jgi:hypothetical protein
MVTSVLEVAASHHYGFSSQHKGKARQRRPDVTECAELTFKRMQTELLKGLGNKVPKVVLAAVDTLLAMVTSFGVPTVPPKPILKALPAAFAHKDATVRERAKELTVELSRWVGLPVVGQVRALPTHLTLCPSMLSISIQAPSAHRCPRHPA